MSKNRTPELPIIVVDDDRSILNGVASLLASKGYNNVVTIDDSRTVVDAVEAQGAELVLIDLAMPHMDGRSLLLAIKDRFPDLPVIVVTATNDISTAIQCMQDGAIDYVVKGLESTRLLSGISRALELRQVKRNYAELKQRIFDGKLRNPAAFRDIISRNREMHSMFLFVESIAKTREAVLVSGETGVGKDLIAEAIHSASGREGPFVRVNSAGLDDDMFSDTLFGHTRGAFTGANEERKGFVNAAKGGTLFLDEIGDLSPQSQVKLLQLVERREYYPVGSDLLRKAEVRFIVATNRDLAAKVASGEFRKDLYFRLATHSVTVPALRDRPDDIPLLTDHFLSAACAEMACAIPKVSQKFYDDLSAYSFPGNVRELRALVFDAIARADGEPSLAHIPAFSGIENRNAFADTERIRIETAPLEAFPTIRESVEALIAEALKRSSGNQSAAAAMLGITPAALSKRLKRKTGSESADTDD